MNGLRQISASRNLSVITATNNDLAAGLIIQLDASSYLVNVMSRTRSWRWQKPDIACLLPPPQLL
jgi:hypothetical protein